MLKKVTELADEAPVAPPPSTPTLERPPRPLPGTPRRSRAAAKHAREVAKEMVVYKQKDRHRQRQLARHKARTERDSPSESAKGRGQAASSGRAPPQSPPGQANSGGREPRAGARPGFKSERLMREDRGSSRERSGRRGPTQSSAHSGMTNVSLGGGADGRSGSGSSWDGRGRGRGGPSRSQQNGSRGAGRSAW